MVDEIDIWRSARLLVDQHGNRIPGTNTGDVYRLLVALG
jgi:hypothetical protein